MFQTKKHVFVYNKSRISSKTGILPHQLLIRETTSLPIWQIFVSSDRDSFGIIPILNLQGIGYLIAGCIAFLLLKGKISIKVHIESNQQ